MAFFQLVSYFTTTEHMGRTTTFFKFIYTIVWYLVNETDTGLFLHGDMFTKFKEGKKNKIFIFRKHL